MNKRILPVILICLMVISILPINEFITLGAGFEPDLQHEYTYFESNPNNSKLLEAKAYLENLGIEKLNDKYQRLNPITFAMYGIVAYDFPSGDTALPPDTSTGRTERRYIGTDIKGNLITNDYFPNDANSGKLLLDKNWIPSSPPSTNINSWEKAPDNTEFRKKYIYETNKLLNDGGPIPYSLKDILAKRVGSDYREYINLQACPMFSVKGSARLQHQTSTKIWYDTFTIPQLVGDNALKVNISTPKDAYTILPGEDYIDIPVTVTSTINIVDNYLLSLIETKWVKYENNQKQGQSYTYNKRIYKSSLDEGTSTVTLTGYAGIKSSLPGDQEKIESGTKDIWITVAEDNLIAQLNVPKTAGINQEFTVADVSYIPQGATILSSTLTKKTTTESESSVSGWGKTTKSIQESHPVKTTITYKLTIMLDNGQVDSDTKSIEIIDNRAVDATADLVLDPYTYEGHPAYAHDESVFDVEGTTYYAKQAYEEGLADNDFDVVESTPHSIKRLSDTTAKIIFQDQGFYNVALEVETQDGKELNDIEPIEVRKTPYIEDFLGGVPKQNRRQVLNLSIATHPSYSVIDFWVEIEDTDTGEKVHLTSQKQNSTLIKTRDLTFNQTEYYTNYTLEFLTKNNAEKVYQYTAYVKDSKGDTDIVSEYFTVYPDLPPVTQIDMLDSFLRNENSNIANIIAEDGTVSTDGDQVERTWTVAFDTNNNGLFTDEVYKNITTLGYEDLSFGTKQKVKFNKTGVGKANVRLDVKEVWIEPTLPEYVTDAERLTGFTTKATDVQNIAPMVSVEPIITDKEDIVILTTQKDIQSAIAQKTQLEQYMKENAIDSKITIVPFENENLQALKTMFILKNQMSYVDDEYAEEFEIDNKNIYYIKPSSIADTDSNGKDEAIPPYTIIARNIATNTIKWSYVVQDKGMELMQDDTEKYLYILYSNKTIILDKKTGALVTTLNYKVDATPYYTEQGLYFFSDGAIQKLDGATGTLKTIKNIGSKCSKRIEGKIHFVYSEGESIFRGIFDPLTESVQSHYILDNNIDKDGDYANKYQAEDFDTYGTIMLVKHEKIEKYSYDKIAHVKLINKNNEIILEKQFEESVRRFQYGNAKDESGKIYYLWRYWEGKGSTRYYDHIQFYGIDGSDSGDIKREAYTDSAPSDSVSYVKYSRTDNALYYLRGGIIGFGYHEPSARIYKISLPTYSIDIVTPTFADVEMEDARESEIFHAMAGLDKRYIGGEQKIFVNKHYITLEDTIIRSLNSNASFREGYQKNVIFMDDVNNSNTTLMQKVIDYLNSIGAKFTSVAKTTAGSNYAVRIKDILQGNAVTYNTFNMQNNLINIGNIINTNKESPKNPIMKVTGTSSSNATISDGIVLEQGEEYSYEYDIQYTKKGSITNADVFNLTHSLTNTAYTGLTNNVAVTAQKEEYEDFNPYHGRNPFFSYSGNWSIDDNKNGGEYCGYDDDLKPQTYANRDSTITFTTDKSSVLSFDYKYTEGYIYNENDKLWTEFQIWIDNVEIPYYILHRGTGTTLHYSKELPAGNHEIRLHYRAFYEDIHYAYIDNLKVSYITKKTDGSMDNGIFTKNNATIKENEWQQISGTFRTPYETSQYVKRHQGSNTYENFSDGNLNFTFTGDYIASGGRYVPKDLNYPVGVIYDTDYEHDESRCGTLTFTVPSNSTGYLTFSVYPYISYAYDGSEDYDYEVGKIYGGGFNEKISEREYDHNRYEPFWKHYARTYGPGTHTINFYSRAYWGRTSKSRSFVKSGTRYYGWNIEGYMAVDNINLKIEPNNYNSSTEFIDNSIATYSPSKNYEGNSTVKFQYSSSSNSEFLIKNFKLYRIVNGEKVLYKDYGTITQDMLNNIFTITGTRSTVTVANEEKSADPEDAPLIYSKGELVLYNIFYDDYENDPSKKQYWQYTHTPFNDGLHPDNGKILNSPIERFYIDGKYVVKHWQEDSTGVTPYDKLSNQEEITFYVQGNAIAPEVTYITTIPSEVKEGNNYKIEIGVDDQDKDVLNTKIELYKENRLIYTYTKNNVAPVSGVYPPIVSGFAPTATAGKYTVVATASDASGTGIKSYKFTVVSEGKIEGFVMHTDQWDANRKKYNLSKTGSEESPRAYNVFWSGERFMLRGEAEGNPTSVQVQILGTSYSTNLSSSDGGSTWTGSLWDESMINKWGRTSPETLTFRFTANFSGGVVRTDDVQIIVDSEDDYWDLHRMF